MPVDPSLNGFGLSNIFPGIRFESPVVVTSPRGETNRVFVVERTGKIFVIPNLARPEKVLFLDLTEGLNSTYMEMGLLGMAFHPRFKVNGYFFVFRTMAGGTFSVSRFQCPDPDASEVQKGTETLILSQNDSSELHNGGDLKFGPDGYLYISVGYDGIPESRRNASQYLDQAFFGGIFRIDVDQNAGNLRPNGHDSPLGPYLVPNDNPFIGFQTYNHQVLNQRTLRTEFFALGMRNPWRMNFDPVTGALYVGDVGGGRFEEVNKVVKGGNYGWPHLEGNAGSFATPNLPPQFQYNHGYGSDEGNAVVGGVVYRGAIASIHGQYVFADYVSGHVWAGNPAVTGGKLNRLFTKPGISCFAYDPRNSEILAANYLDGTVNSLVFAKPSSNLIPPDLSATRLFSNLRTLKPSDGVVPYSINNPFWSDNAFKTRWAFLPRTLQEISLTNSRFELPAGSVFIKHFELEMTNGVATSRRRLETRVLVRNTNGVYGVTYRWGKNPTNAFLVSDAGMDEEFSIFDGGKLRKQVWRYPSQRDCRLCHTPEAGYILGFKPSQLIKPGSCEISFNGAKLDMADCEPVTPVVPFVDAGFPLQYKVRSYFDVNCSQCHFEEGFVPATSWDARMTTPIHEAGIVNGKVYLGPLTPSERMIKPGAPDDSKILRRISKLDLYQKMPPVGHTTLNTTAISSVKKWIETLPQFPWESADSSVQKYPGSSQIAGNQVILSPGANSTNPFAMHLLFRPVNQNGQLAASIDVKNLPMGGRAGLMLGPKSGLLSSPNGVLVSKESPTATVYFLRRGSLEFVATLKTSRVWLRAGRNARALTFHYSEDGKVWRTGGEMDLEVDSNINIGFAAFAHATQPYYEAVFTPYSFLQVKLSNADDVEVPDKVNLGMVWESRGEIPQQYFYKINEGESFPLFKRESVAARGIYSGANTVSMRAAFGAPGLAFETILKFEARPALGKAWLIESTSASLGGSTGVLGRNGILLRGMSNALPGEIVFEHTGNAGNMWDARSAAFDFNFLDGLDHIVSLFFNGENRPDTLLKISVLNPTNRLLEQVLFTNGFVSKKVAFMVSGSGRIQILQGPGSAALLEGILFDNPPPPALKFKFLSPDTTTPKDISKKVPVSAAVTTGHEIRSVSYYGNGEWIGESKTPPYKIFWENPLRGSNTIKALVHFRRHGTFESTNLTFFGVLPTSEIEFLGFDRTTRENWQDKYGGSEVLLPGDPLKLKNYDLLLTPNQTYHIWDSGNQDPAGWVGPEEIAVSLYPKYGREYLVTLYFIDSPSRLRILDLNGYGNGSLLSRTTLKNFDGDYARWRVKGMMDLRISGVRGNSVFSGLFIDEISLSPPVKASRGDDNSITLRFDTLTDSGFFLESSSDFQSWRPEIPLETRRTNNGSLRTTEFRLLKNPGQKYFRLRTE